MTKITQLLILFQCLLMFGQVEQTLTLGSGTSSSATRGPFQRSDSGSGSAFSRASMVYSATELAGLTSTTLISQINFDLGETNIITASGDATMLIYMKNTSATDVAPVDTEWSTVIAGATLVGTYTFNTTNNFPGAKGFMDFELDSDFAFAGDALEVLIDWDCSGLVPADPGQPNLLFSDDGSLNWRWDDTAHVSLLYDASSSAPTALDTRKSQRVNTQIVYTDPNADLTLTIGAGTSASATRGPFQRSDFNSSSVFSRASMVYTAAELSALTSDATISQIDFDLGETNIITATGDAIMKIYMKNSTATEVAAVDTEWSTVLSGATLVGTYTFNIANNFPGAKGFLGFELDSDFDYTGGSLEVLVDWDCSGLVPADPGQPNLLFSDDGSLNWRWDNTAHASLLYDASSSAPTALDTRKTQRVNTQFVYIINIPLSVAQNTFPSEFLLAPNPASDYTTIKTDETIDSVELYDMLGKKVKASVIGNRINVSTLPSALYLVKISSANGVAVKRLLKR